MMRIKCKVFSFWAIAKAPGFIRCFYFYNKELMNINIAAISFLFLRKKEKDAAANAKHSRIPITKIEWMSNRYCNFVNFNKNMRKNVDPKFC